MPTTLNSDMKIYNDLAQTAYLERLQDNLQIFNEASNGAIILIDELIEGDLKKRAFYKIGGSIEHRDVNSTAAAAGKKITAGEMVGVKIPFKYGPYEATEESFKRRLRSPEEFSLVVGQDYADALLKGYFTFAAAALDGAISNNTAMQVAKKFSTDGKKVLTTGMRAFGDQFGRLALWVMDSASYFTIVESAIAEKLYQETDTVIYGGLPGTMGIPVLVTDQAKANTIYGLQAGAITITNSQLADFRSYPINTQENLTIGVRAEGAFNLDVLGYSWKDSAGANPDLTALAAKANWEQYATSNKNTAGVIINITE